MTTPAAAPANPVAEAGGVRESQLDSRPATVTIAVVLQLAIVALAIGVLVLAWFGYQQQDELITRAAKLAPGTDPYLVESERSGNLFMVIAASVLAGGAALWFGATVWPTLRRSNAARIVTAVGSGLLTMMLLVNCFCGGMLTFMLFPMTFSDVVIEDGPYGESWPDESWPGESGSDGSFPDPGMWSGDPFHEELWRLESTTMPWQGMVTVLSVLLVSTLAVAVLVLLLVPPSHRWFSPASSRLQPQRIPVYYPVYYPAYGPPAPGAPAPGWAPPGWQPVPPPGPSQPAQPPAPPAEPPASS